MIPQFLYTHGWAMDGSLWDGVRGRLGGRAGATRDLGYFADPFDPPPDGRPVIAVGHSLGVMQTLDRPPPGLVGMVAINGFSRFSAGLDHDAGIPVRLLHRMLQRLQQEPDATATAFRDRCGLAGALPGPARLPALERGLELLCQGDFRQACRNLRVPVLALAGRKDSIVPPALSAACFDEILWEEEAGHLLPVTHPDFCARALADFAGRIVA